MSSVGFGVELRRLRYVLVFVRQELFPRVRRRVYRLEVAETRGRVVEKLLEAMNILEGLARSSTRKNPRGGGGVPPKARWYQLMAQTAQILDGVLRNVEMEQVRQKLETLEQTVDELQKQTRQPAGQQ